MFIVFNQHHSSKLDDLIVSRRFFLECLFNGNDTLLIMQRKSCIQQVSNNSNHTKLSNDHAARTQPRSQCFYECDIVNADISDNEKLLFVYRQSKTTYGRLAGILGESENQKVSQHRTQRCEFRIEFEILYFILFSLSIRRVPFALVNSYN